MVSFVNSASGITSVPGAGTISTAAFNATAGNLIVVSHRGSGTGTTPTDTAGNTYTRIGSSTLNTNVKMWYAYNISGNASNVVSLSVNDRDFGALVAVQYSGVVTASDPLEVFDEQNATSSSSVTSDSFNTSSSIGVIVACASLNTNTTELVAGSNYTMREVSSSWSLGMEDRIPGNSLTGETASMSFAGSWNWGMVVAAFLDADPASTFTPKIMIF